MVFPSVFYAFFKNQMNFLSGAVMYTLLFHFILIFFGVQKTNKQDNKILL